MLVRFQLGVRMHVHGKLVQINCIGGLEVDEIAAKSIAMRIAGFEPDSLAVCPSNPAMYVAALVERNTSLVTEVWPEIADIGRRDDVVFRAIRAINRLRQEQGERVSLVVHPGFSAYLLAAIENVGVDKIGPIWWGSVRVVKV